MPLQRTTVNLMLIQEMSNPQVWPHLHFFPEVTSRVSQEWQSSKWLDELDPLKLTPMVRKDLGGGIFKDYFTFEPTMLHDNTVCIPTR
jgi:hypothetical protein